MILTGDKIVSEVNAGLIEIKPFDSKNVRANSYSVQLGDTLLVYNDEILDTAKKNPTTSITIPPEGIVLEKGKFYVGHIKEFIGSDSYVPLLHGIDEVAFLGLFIHVTANLIDIGNHCNFSLMLFATENIKVKAGMNIAQVSFWKTSGYKKMYKGKYKNVKGPAASQSYLHAKR